MNKRTRLVVTILFAVLIILAAAVTRFYVNVPDSTNSRDKQAEIATVLASDGSGYAIFRDNSGDLGIAQSGRIVAEPQWKDLSFAGSGRCIAAKKLGGRLLYGCIDYEGNVIVPFVYSSISGRDVGKYRFYLAETAEDGSLVIYDDQFSPCFRRSWSSCAIKDNEITLTTDSGTYRYAAVQDGLVFRSAAVNGDIQGCGYELSVYSRALLSKLSVPMIEMMIGDTEKYLDYAFGGGDELLPEKTAGSKAAFTQLFGSDERVISRRLTGISNIYIYSVSNGEGAQEFEVSVTADVEITYKGERNRKERLEDSCKAAVRFRGSSESDLTIVSGGFDKALPDIPENDEQGG